MFTMGTDFKYQYAESWFRQMDKLIHYVNKVKISMDITNADYCLTNLVSPWSCNDDDFNMLFHYLRMAVSMLCIPHLRFILMQNMLKMCHGLSRLMIFSRMF